MNIKFTVKGAKELEAMLREIGPAAAKNAGAASLRAGAKVIVARAKELVPVKTGALRDSLGFKVSRRGANNGILTAHIGSLNKEARLIHLVEFGTRAHSIRTGEGGYLASGEIVFGKEVQHPGTPAQPFLRPAIDEKGGDAVLVMGTAMGKSIDRHLKKMRRVLPNGRSA